MERDEQVQYLANIYYVARVDGQVDRLEEKLIDHIAKGIQAGYFETYKGKDESEKEDFSIKYPKRWSDRIRNVEEMLLVAFADEKLHSLEKKILMEYANHLGINQTQFKVIREETKKRLAELKGSLI